MIRRARVQDAKALAEVHVRSWQGGYAHVFSPDALAGLSVARRAQRWAEWLRDGRSCTFAAEEDGEVLGFVSVGPSRVEEAVGELYSIYVDPRHWRRGLGRSLIDAGEEWLRAQSYTEATLWVLEDNPGAHAFYESRGWRLDGAKQPITFEGTDVTEVRYRKRL